MNTKGMVHVEFLVAALPFLTLVMGLAQLMLLDAAKLAVMHAAGAAARAAVVVLDDDPKFYGGEARNSAPAGSSRFAEIERAAAGALVAVDPPNHTASQQDSVMNAVSTPSPSASLRDLFSPSRWMQSRVRVTFPNSSGASFGPNDNVTAKVEFDYPCVMPLVRRLLCKNGRTHLLSSQATLTNQGASYDYHGGAASSPVGMDFGANVGGGLFE